jgi:alpha-L-fucosidase
MSSRWFFVRSFLCLCFAIMSLLHLASCEPEKRLYNSMASSPGEGTGAVIIEAASVTPSKRQMAWQERELIGFIHFTVNTFTDMEWGTGKEDPSIFNPSELDCKQWVEVCKDAGMELIILTAKHHDGFCLWPSKYTEHSVKNSPWKGGKGDVVRDLSNACRKAGLKFGVYLSPWDRHEPSYGDSPTYNKYFTNQLKELLTKYGEISEVWFDGACGEGPNGKRQVYDWDAYYKVVRKYAPKAVIFNGPDVRWVGNEAGYARESEWSVLKVNKSFVEFAMEDPTKKDLGSRSKLVGPGELVWLPAETDVSVRPGWFYHESQDDKVKSLDKLLDIYYSSVGRNSVLLLNIPPDRRGLIHENDAMRLREFRKVLDATFDENLALGAEVRCSSCRKSTAMFSGENRFGPGKIVDGDKETYWTTDEGQTLAILEVDFEMDKTFNVAELSEYIKVGQRVEEFGLEAWSSSGWKEFAKGTTIGYKRLLRFDNITTRKVRIKMLRSRVSPTLSEFGLYFAPPVETALRSTSQ